MLRCMRCAARSQEQDRVSIQCHCHCARRARPAAQRRVVALSRAEFQRQANQIRPPGDASATRPATRQGADAVRETRLAPRRTPAYASIRQPLHCAMGCNNNRTHDCRDVNAWWLGTDPCARNARAVPSPSLYCMNSWHYACDCAQYRPLIDCGLAQDLQGRGGNKLL